MPGCMGRPLIPVITLLLGGCGSSGFVMPDALEPLRDLFAELVAQMFAELLGLSQFFFKHDFLLV